MSQKVTEVTDGTFEAEVLKSALPVLVDFWAPWCGPCRMVAPVVDKLADQMSAQVRFTKMNIDENQLTPQRYGVMAIPTILVFKGGEVVQQHVGALSEPAMKSLLQKVL